MNRSCTKTSSFTENRCDVTPLLKCTGLMPHVTATSLLHPDYFLISLTYSTNCVFRKIECNHTGRRSNIVVPTHFTITVNLLKIASVFVVEEFI